MATQLEILAQKYRNEVLGPNIYKEDKNYSSRHKNALSDGDEKGKGENNGSVGGKTDINKRTESITKNKYNESKKYPNF
jgi:hypothetical protein